MSKKADLSKPSKKSSDKGRHDKPVTLLPGQPGYRTRDGRSGLDPIDMRTEAAHTAGTIIQKLFTGSIRNPFYLLLLGILGLVLITPLVLAISEITSGDQFAGFAWNAWTILLVAAIIGVAILVNSIKNLIKMVVR
jgi:hypothetical protein